MASEQTLGFIEARLQYAMGSGPEIYILRLMIPTGSIDRIAPYIQALEPTNCDMRWAPDPKYIFYD